MDKYSKEDRTSPVLKVIRILALYTFEAAIAATVASQQALVCPWPVRTLVTALALALFWNVERRQHELSEKDLEGTIRREFKNREQETAFRAHVARDALCWRARITSLVGLMAIMSWATHTFPFWQGIALCVGSVLAWLAVDHLVIRPRMPTSTITDEPGRFPDVRQARP